MAQPTFTKGDRQMKNTYYAQPYDMDANGFYFSTKYDYKAALNTSRNSYGQQVEEFEIQFIDGDCLDGELFDALAINQATIIGFIDKLVKWSKDDKIKLILAVGESGYSFDISQDDPADFDIDIYPDTSLRDLADQFVDEGLFGEISDRVMMYLDYDRIARDLGYDYTQTRIAGETYTFRCE